MSRRKEHVIAAIEQVKGLWPERDPLEGVRDLRLRAIEAVASEHEVTEETVRDACVRQLEPQVASISEFDAALEDWLRGYSDRLQKIVVRSVVDKQDIKRAMRLFR